MKVTYHIGKEKISHNTSVIPPIGTTVNIESPDKILSAATYIVHDVKIKLYMDHVNVYEEVDVYLAIEATETIVDILTEFTKTQT